MRVGITTATAGDLNIWASGITQNVVFLAQLMRHIGFVDQVVLVDAGDAASLGPQVDLGALGLPLVPMARADEHTDVIIELGGALPLELARLLRARGKRLVYHCVGQPYANLLDITLFDRPGHFLPPQRFDRVWLLPKDLRHVSMMRTVHRCPVQVSPYLWDPMFLQARMTEIEHAGHRFDFVARQQGRPLGSGWRVAIFEPNLSPIKTSIIPMLVSDVAARQQPQAIDHLFVMNAEHLAQHATMLHLGRSMDLVQNHRASFLGRHDVAGFMAAHGIDAVVSHQIGNDQNYLYLDVLYGGYPLIHNSDWLAPLGGYHYPDNDIDAGAGQLLRAMASHGPAASSALFQQLSPHHPPNVEAYAELLKDVMAGEPLP